VLFNQEMRAINPQERVVLVSIAKGITTSAKIGKILRKDSSYARQYIRYLEEKGYLENTQRGRYTLVDPVLAEWIRTKY